MPEDTRTYPVPSVVKAPAIIKLGNDYFESKEDVKLSIADESDDVSTITRGVIGHRLKGRKVEVKFKPVAFSKFSSLFAVLGLTRGARVFGTTNTACEIYGVDGVKVVLPRAAITGVPSVGCGVGKELLGEFTITALPDPTKAFSNLASLVSFSSGVTMPSLPTLTDADLESAGFVGILMADSATPAAGDIFVDLVEGAEISFDLKLNECKIDRCGLFDYTFSDFTPTAKLKPAVADLAKWQSLVNLTASPKLGGLIKPSHDLVVRGLNSGEPQFTLSKVACKGTKGQTFGDAERYDEVELTALGNYGVGKFSASTTADNWQAITQVAAAGTVSLKNGAVA